jgi:acid phosphatase type 7
MTFDCRRSKHEKARRRKFHPQVILSFFAILTISSLVACTPPIPSTETIDSTATQPPATGPVVLAATDGSTPIVEAPSASPLPPPVTSTSKAPALGTFLVFVTDADARVRQSRPSANYGTGATLQVDGEKDSRHESFIRFTVAGVSGTIQSARLRLYVTDNGTRNGPAVYATSNSWSEAEITWDNRPAPTSEAADNKESLGTNNWVEYDVTPLIGGEGIFSFVLVGDSSDAVHFSSRQGAQPPELVLTLGDTTVDTATVTPTGSQENAILVGAGDISGCDNDNDELTAQLLDAIPGTVFTTGDNAYNSGTYTEYLNCYQPTWGRHKERTKPVPGNHEYRSDGAAGYFQYFNNIPSYYAYNLGSWRVYALNSEIDVSASSAQVVWLQADLAANPSQCVLAYWHQPRWSSGSQHGSNEDYQALWQMLYEAGAELVINGHDHLYERFAEMDATGAPVSPGLREIIVGTGGGSLYEFDTLLPSSEVRDPSTFGVLKLTLHIDRYDWEFIPMAGKSFTDRGTTHCH